MRVQRTVRARLDEGATPLAFASEPLSEHDRARLREYWAYVIEASYATSGEPLPVPRFNAAARPARRELRRRAARLVHALPAMQRLAVDGEAA